MGKYLNVIIAIVILFIVTAVCSHYFYKKGQEETWEAAKKLVPLQKGELYLCVEKNDANGVTFLTVQKISEAVKDMRYDQKNLQFRLSLARDGISLQEYNNKYRDRQ